jgi:hypothetical protein
MRFLIGAAIALWATTASARPIINELNVKDFFSKLEKAAADLAEGGMDLNRIRCNDAENICSAFYGAGNSVTGEAPSKEAGVETVTVTMELAGEDVDFC